MARSRMRFERDASVSWMRISFLTGIVCAILLVAIEPIAAGDAASSREGLRGILKKNGQYMGWSLANKRIRSYVLRGHNAVFDETLYYVAGGVTLEKNTSTKLGLSTASRVDAQSDKPTVWTQSIDGFRASADAQEVAALTAARALFDGELPDATPIRASSINGKSAIRVHIAGGKDVD